MRFLFVLLLFCLCQHSDAQKEINEKDASKHIGDTVTIVADMEGVKTFTTQKGKLILLNVGQELPKQYLTLVINSADLKTSMVIPNKSIKGEY
jgi:hypothetical protein